MIFPCKGIKEEEGRNADVFGEKLSPKNCKKEAVGRYNFVRACVLAECVGGVVPL